MEKCEIVTRGRGWLRALGGLGALGEVGELGISTAKIRKISDICKCFGGKVKNYCTFFWDYLEIWNIFRIFVCVSNNNCALDCTRSNYLCA